MEDKVKCPVCGKETTKEKKEQIFKEYPSLKELLDYYEVESLVDLPDKN